MVKCHEQRPKLPRACSRFGSRPSVSMSKSHGPSCTLRRVCSLRSTRSWRHPLASISTRGVAAERTGAPFIWDQPRTKLDPSINAIATILLVLGISAVVLRLALQG
jgi:hypothetical protein